MAFLNTYVSHSLPYPSNTDNCDKKMSFFIKIFCLDEIKKVYFKNHSGFIITTSGTKRKSKDRKLYLCQLLERKDNFRHFKALSQEVAPNHRS